WRLTGAGYGGGAAVLPGIRGSRRAMIGLQAAGRCASGDATSGGAARLPCGQRTRAGWRPSPDDRRDDRGFRLSNVQYDEVGRDFDAVRDRRPEGRQVWLDRVAQHMPDPPPTAVVDVGSGTGIWSKAFAGRFGCTVHGVEPSERSEERRGGEGCRDR